MKFTILFENMYKKQFCCSYFFDSVEEAHNFLINEKGYSESNRVFIKNNTKAYIQPLTRYYN